MNVSIEKKKAEAIKRMKAFKIFPETIKQFKTYGLVSCSEPPIGGKYCLDDKQKKVVEEFEREHDALVYFVVSSFTEFGKLDALLYVSDYEEEWEMDNEDIKDGYPLSYVHNYDATWCSEFGSIAVKGISGGLVRVG